MAGTSSVKQHKLAVLIDADNAQSCLVGPLLAEVARYGTACVKRAYGDWTGTSLKGWKDQLLKHSINRSSSLPIRTARTRQTPP
jgi:hypothetical protein